MIKVTLYVGAFLVLANAAVLNTALDSRIKEGCESESELWGSADGRKFYFCIGSNQSYEEVCPPDTFFINNVTVTGCIPLSLVADNCIYHGEAPTCKDICLRQPQPHTDPTKFYYCIEEDAEPQIGDCPSEKAFINQNGWLGCLEWSKWRIVRGCSFGN